MNTYTEPRRVKWQPVKGDARDRMRTQAAKDYEDGSSIRAVAAHLSEQWGPVSFGLARDLLLEAKVPMRSKTSRLHRPRRP
ncbi:helix-turn-helix domain-containing protein [Streptomyces cadmiisoli]|uniref:helix-turn-helix domain-containing protein n=1 Tax=Streptomyces cadmiisoli TaxID=2184053 RepID=UPI003656289E